MKAILTTLSMSLFALPAFAVDTAKIYNSGILVLLFVGFCALLIVAQLVPALLALFGMTRAVAQGSRKTAKVRAGQ